MPWTIGPRGFFAALPPAEKLPEKARPLAVRFSALLDDARVEAKKAEEMRRQREQVRRDYEEALASSMLDSKQKTPTSPLPDYDRGIEDAEHRAGAALRAASRLYGELGDLLVASKAESSAETSDWLSTAVVEALEGVEQLRPLLVEVAEDLAVLGWYSDLRPVEALGYAPMTGEGDAMDRGLGQIVSALRRISASLAVEATESEAVPA